MINKNLIVVGIILILVLLIIGLGMLINNGRSLTNKPTIKIKINKSNTETIRIFIPSYINSAKFTVDGSVVLNGKDEKANVIHTLKTGENKIKIYNKENREIYLNIYIDIPLINLTKENIDKYNGKYVIVRVKPNGWTCPHYFLNLPPSFDRGAIVYYDEYGCIYGREIIVEYNGYYYLTGKLHHNSETTFLE